MHGATPDRANLPPDMANPDPKATEEPGGEPGSTAMAAAMQFCDSCRSSPAVPLPRAPLSTHEERMMLNWYDVEGCGVLVDSTARLIVVHYARAGKTIEMQWGPGQTHEHFPAAERAALDWLTTEVDRFYYPDPPVAPASSSSALSHPSVTPAHPCSTPDPSTVAASSSCDPASTTAGTVQQETSHAQLPESLAELLERARRFNNDIAVETLFALHGILRRSPPPAPKNGP